MIYISLHKTAGATAKPIATLIISSSIIAGCTPHTAMVAPQPTRVYFSHATENQQAIDLSKQLRPAAEATEENTNNASLPAIVVRFDNDSAKVRDEDIERLQSFILNFGTRKMPNFIITGHTDSNHSDEYNKGLSQRRAIATLQQMEQMGVPLSRMSIKALGESHPEADNTSDAGRQLNRRVTVQIIASS